jgi:spore maturation protein CgeB
MKANELRIGNWVSTIYGMEFQVYPMAFKQMPTDEKNNLILTTWKPIPLTEEWLLKLGFIPNPYEDRYEKGVLHVECMKTKGETYLWVENMPHIKYVHELQNLYFALTGEELINVQK